MTFQIKFHQIRAFVEVAREGSIRGASRSLAISQPALTKAIKELEEGLSAQLFVRRSQGVALTENGELGVVPGGDNGNARQGREIHRVCRFRRKEANGFPCIHDGGGRGRGSN